MDGTIVDTEPYWMVAEEALVGSFGGTWTHEDGLRLVGNGLDDSARILQEAGVDLPVAEIIDRLSDRVMEQILVEVPWRPGARELLREIREAGIPTALVTMSIGRMARQVADAVPFDAFDHVVAGDDVAPQQAPSRGLPRRRRPPRRGHPRLRRHRGLRSGRRLRHRIGRDRRRRAAPRPAARR